MQEHYYLLRVRPSSHHSLFSDFLSDTIPVGFEETDEGFVIRSEDDLSTIGWGVEQFAEALNKALDENIEVELEYSKHKSEDWVKKYQENISAVEVPPFYIHPTWEDAREGMLNIALDPALAFGTGHHPTTASCLKAIASSVKPKQSVLDVGCGSGVLALAAAKLNALVDACDSDEISVDNTKDNFEQNGLELHSLWTGSANMATKKYDVVIANIVADVLIFIEKDLNRAVKNDGILILSGILDKYEAKVLRAYKNYELIEKVPQDEWVTLILKGTD
ncbi:MAG: 50S ribosomal protein L11 methyltransferase [Campylobacterota bacterium]|nr:50S ribosomal protein L11 methyltransferase [Campylobacterota bacterium]